MTDFEAEYLSDCIKHKKLKIDFIEAIVDFIISGSFKWLDHIKNYDLDSSWITKEKLIKNYVIQNQIPNIIFPTAMMFNLSYVNANQRKLLELIEIQFDYVKEDFEIFLTDLKISILQIALKEQKKVNYLEKIQ